MHVLIKWAHRSTLSLISFFAACSVGVSATIIDLGTLGGTASYGHAFEKSNGPEPFEINLQQPRPRTVSQHHYFIKLRVCIPYALMVQRQR